MSLHFTGMSAITIVPDAAIVVPEQLLSGAMLTLAVVSITSAAWSSWAAWAPVAIQIPDLRARPSSASVAWPTPPTRAWSSFSRARSKATPTPPSADWRARRCPAGRTTAAGRDPDLRRRRSQSRWRASRG
ncbi:hypothetical protein ACRAWD_25900 [Caulobacter segnis]